MSCCQENRQPIEKALEKYAAVLPYLAYENSAFWTRSGFFLVAHTALLAFVATNGLPLKSSRQDEILVYFVVGILGIVLGVAWLLSIAAGKFWIRNWHDALLKLEPDAFGDLEVLRGKCLSTNTMPRTQGMRWPHTGAKSIVIIIPLMFVVLWIALFALTIKPQFSSIEHSQQKSPVAESTLPSQNQSLHSDSQKADAFWSR